MAFITIAYAKPPVKPGKDPDEAGYSNPGALKNKLKFKKDVKTSSPIDGPPLAKNVFSKSMKTQMPGGTSGVIPGPPGNMKQVGHPLLEKRPTGFVKIAKYGMPMKSNKKASTGGKKFKQAAATKPAKAMKQAGEYGNSSPQPQKRAM